MFPSQYLPILRRTKGAHDLQFSENENFFVDKKQYFAFLKKNFHRMTSKKPCFENKPCLEKKSMGQLKA